MNYILTLWLLIFIPDVPVFSQNLPENIYSVKIFNKDSKIIKGLVTSITDTTVTIKEKATANTQTISYKNINRIAIRREDNINKKVLIGAGTGLFLGIAVSAIAIIDDKQNFISKEIIVAISTISGFVTGAIIGTATALVRENYQINRSLSLFQEFYSEKRECF